MDIKSQLIQILVRIPLTQMVNERRALLSITGFDFLNVRISTFEQSNYVFFSELVELIFSEGQIQLLTFIRALLDSEFIGFETKDKLNNLIIKIEALELQQWNHESIQPTNNKKFVEVRKEQPKIKLIVPSVPGTQAFEFTVVTINAQGKEIDYQQRQAYSLREDLGNGVILEMVYIPEGQFTMGSPEAEGKRYLKERPQRLVTTKPFFISKYPITQTEWKQIASLPEARQNLKLRPSRQGGKNHPVTQVSWFDAVDFCRYLSQKTGYKYSLPSEAQWEYACRAGSKTPFHFGETINCNLANYDANFPYRLEPKGVYRQKTVEVNTFPFANLFGLFDMHGNVWEWCLDNWHENYNNAPKNEDAWIDDSNNHARVIRGGSWRNEPCLCRSSSRQFNYASETLNNIGFRVVRSVSFS
jgi:formylglycine-generating enzyme required for sulfatase activity